MTEIIITKANGVKEPFDEEKLKTSLRRSGASDESIKYVMSRMKRHIKTGITTREIYRKAFAILNKHEKPAAIQYSLRRAIMDLGPSGFPFEEFVAEILKKKGYKTKTGTVLRGKCVEHEIDVLAYNHEKVIAVEAKFHNQHGMKTDTKVALYVHARFEDLVGVPFMIDGEQRHLDEGWLVTNTKFTSAATNYGECKNMTMIGWNYPVRGNLQDLVNETNVHPITLLNSLSGSQKNSIIKEGLVLCKDIIDSPESLKQIGLSSNKIEKVLMEARSICRH